MAKKILTLTLAVMMVLALVACGGTPVSPTQPSGTDTKESDKTPEQPVETAAAEEEFVLGSSQPLSGNNAQVGDAALKGAQLAVKELNKKGGIGGKKIRLVSYDDQSSPEEAVKVATKLIEVDKANAVAGSLISSCMLSSGEFFNEAKVPVIGSGLSPTWMEQDWEYVFRACPNSGFAMPSLAQGMKDLGISTISIFEGLDDSSKSSADAMREACKVVGITVLNSETYVEGDTDFSGQIAKIINNKPDAVFCSAYSTTQPFFSKQLRQFGYDGLCFSKETLSADNIRVAEDSSNYWVFEFPYVTYNSVDECDVPIIKEFLELYQAEYNEMPYHDCAYRAWDAVMVFAEAARIAGSTDGEAIKNAINQISDFKGLGGTFDFTKGDREGLHTFNSYIIIDQKYVSLENWIKEGNYEKFKQERAN